MAIPLPHIASEKVLVLSLLSSDMLSLKISSNIRKVSCGGTSAIRLIDVTGNKAIGD